jgi:dTDP-4-amino-4,6-dideoxygalactose transaminase
MIRTIARYGARHIPGSTWTALKAIARGEGVRGPAIREFEERFAEYHGVGHAVSASYGRMAFCYILEALELPRGSEIIFPALTFWVVPEMARILGFRPVFVDIDPLTFDMDPAKFEHAITPNTRAVVPTHLYGQPCDMDPIMSIARAHRLSVIEDCAHALGASYKGRKAGTFGEAAFFSFQMLKPLNSYGGGMAITNNPELAARIRSKAEAEPWPFAKDVLRKILFGNIQRKLIGPHGFTFSMFLAFYIASFFGDYDLSRYLWEKIRPLVPLPESYRKRYTNAQALLGLAMLERIDRLNALNRAHAERLSAGLNGIDAIRTPAAPPETSPVYYQYCIRASDPAALKHHAIRRGIDVEIMHVDICNKLDLFGPSQTHCPVAEATEHTLQLPVYAGLTDRDLDRIVRVIRQVVHQPVPLAPTSERRPQEEPRG